MSRLLAILVLPFALAIMAPLALVFVVLFYISILARAIWTPIGWAAFRKSAQPEPAPKPHFLEVPSRHSNEIPLPPTPLPRSDLDWRGFAGVSKQDSR